MDEILGIPVNFGILLYSPSDDSHSPLANRNRHPNICIQFEILLPVWMTISISERSLSVVIVHGDQVLSSLCLSENSVCLDVMDGDCIRISLLTEIDIGAQ